MFRGQWSFVLLCGESLAVSHQRPRKVPLYMSLTRLRPKHAKFAVVSFCRVGRVPTNYPGDRLFRVFRCLYRASLGKGGSAKNKLHYRCDQHLSCESRPTVSTWALNCKQPDYWDAARGIAHAHTAVKAAGREVGELPSQSCHGWI